MTPSAEDCVTLKAEVLIVSQYLIKFGSHSLFCSRDKTDLIFQVTLQDLVIKGLCEFLEGNSSLYIPTLPSLVATGIAVVDK